MQDHRNDGFNRAGFIFGRLVAAGRLERDKAESDLFKVAVANGYVDKDGEDAARATILSGISAGLLEPNYMGMLEQKPKANDPDGEFEDDYADDSKKKSQADSLLAIATKEAQVFKNGCGEIFATITSDGKTLTYPVRSASFRAWLNLRYFKIMGRVAGSKGALDAAIITLQGLALSAPTHEVFNRVAYWQGKIYYDLGDLTGRVVEIDETGWRIIPSSPVPFFRPKGLKAQVEPQRGGNIHCLRQIMNLKDKDFILVVCFLVSFYQPIGARPHFFQLAEQGTAKTTNTNTIRVICDPNEALTRREPKEARDLFIAAKNNALLAFDNVSYIPQWLSDALCCLSTLSAYAVRSHYSNDEEEIFTHRCQVLINSITDVISRPDLLDRTIGIELPLLDEKQRKQESEIAALFQQFLPLILGALCDAVSVGLRNLPQTRPENLPRMADFATWICACAPAFGYTEAEVLDAYNANRREVQDIAAETSTLAAQLESLAEQPRKGTLVFKGTVTKLLDDLELYADFSGPYSKRPPEDWPKSTRSMGRELRRLAPVLRHRGLDIQTSRGNGQRTVTIRKVSDVLPDPHGTRTNQKGTVPTQNGTAKTVKDGQKAPDSADRAVSLPSFSSFEEKEGREGIEEERNHCGKNGANAPDGTDSEDFENPRNNSHNTPIDFDSFVMGI